MNSDIVKLEKFGHLSLSLYSTFKNNKASGPSSVPTKVFKTFSKPLSKPLADLINLSLSTGKFPSSLKTAKKIPAFKKGE